MGRTAGALGPAPTAAAKGQAAEEGPAASGCYVGSRGPCGSRRGAGGRGRRALAHARPISVGSSRLCHLRT